MRVSAYCAECFERVPLPLDPPAGSVPCPGGHDAITYEHAAAVTRGERVDSCSRCRATAFFSQKDFDQRVGCLLLALGAGLALLAARLLGGIWFVPVLLAFVIVDRVIARRVGLVVICYRCDTEYRDVPDAASVRPYDPHVAERHAELKTIRRMAD